LKEEECIDYKAKFEEWFRKGDYKKYFEDYVAGISFYEMDIEKNSNYFGHEFSLITSIPKNFKIDTISTSSYELNSIDTYLRLINNIDNIKTNTKLCPNNIDKDIFCCFKKNDINISYTLKEKIEVIDVGDIGKVLSIVYLKEDTKKVLLVSISFKSDIDQEEFKIMFKNHMLKIFLRDGYTFKLISKFLNSKKESLINIQNTREAKTSILLFSDITNSTSLLRSNSKEGLFVVRELTSVIAKVAEEYRFNINEIPGDGVLYSKDLYKIVDIKEFLGFLEALYSSYNSKKKEILDRFKNSCEYQSNQNMYINFEDNLDKAYLKTAFCIDGIYFMPIKDISFKQSILYGTNLWDIPRVFNEFYMEKNRGDLLLINKNLDIYLEAFYNVNIDKFIQDIQNNTHISISKYPKEVNDED
jgi:hypothetical protein